MDEITIESMIESLRTQDTGEVCDALAEKTLRMFHEHEGRQDFNAITIDMLHREKDAIKSQNDKLINILYLVSEKL